MSILIFFSAVSLAYSQTTDEGKRRSGASQEATHFFGNGPQSPSQALPKPLTRREINNQTVIDGEVDGDKNPELIPEYMLWGMFLSKIHMHRTPRDVPSSGILSPEIQKLVETVGLSPDQLETLTAIASECTAWKDHIEATPTRGAKLTCDTASTPGSDETPSVRCR